MSATERGFIPSFRTIGRSAASTYYMSMDIAKKVKDTVADARDNVKETLHRSTADAEHARRKIGSFRMTTTEKIGSLANEAKNRMQASAVKVRRVVRKRT